MNAAMSTALAPGEGSGTLITFHIHVDDGVLEKEGVAEAELEGGVEIDAVGVTEMGVCDGLAPGEIVDAGVPVSVAVRVLVGVGDGVAVTVTTNDTELVGDCERVGDAVSVGDGVAVSVRVELGGRDGEFELEAPSDKDDVGVALGDCVGVRVGLTELEKVGAAVGVPEGEGVGEGDWVTDGVGDDGGVLDALSEPELLSELDGEVPKERELVGVGDADAVGDCVADGVVVVEAVSEEDVVAVAEGVGVPVTDSDSVDVVVIDGVLVGEGLAERVAVAVEDADVVALVRLDTDAAADATLFTDSKALAD